jgi:hypothetical protein
LRKKSARAYVLVVLSGVLTGAATLLEVLGCMAVRLEGVLFVLGLAALEVPELITVVLVTGFVTTALTGASGISGTPRGVVVRGLVVVTTGFCVGLVVAGWLEGVGTGWLEGTGLGVVGAGTVVTVLVVAVVLASVFGLKTPPRSNRVKNPPTTARINPAIRTSTQLRLSQSMFAPLEFFE